MIETGHMLDLVTRNEQDSYVPSAKIPFFVQVDSLVMRHSGEESTVWTPLDAHNVLGVIFEHQYIRRGGGRRGGGGG